MKTIIASLTIIAAVVSSHAQGYVLFQNAGNTRVSTNSVVGGVGSNRILANSSQAFYFALFSSTANATTVSGSSTAVVGQAGANSYAFSDAAWGFRSLGTNSIAGQFQSSSADPAVNSGQTTLASGAAQTFVIIGWSVAGVTTINQLATWYNNGTPLSGGWIGESIVSGSILPSAGGASPTVAITGTTAGVIPGFTLGLVAPVPEPGTMVLAGLGGLAMLGLRRKK